MPYMCCVLNCPNSVLNPNRKSYTFHRFPKDEALLNKWVTNINRENFVPTKHTRVCSGHFDIDVSYNVKEDKTTGTLKNRKSLRADAVPTIFNDGPPIQKKMHKLGNRKPKKKQIPSSKNNEDKGHHQQQLHHQHSSDSVGSLSNNSLGGNQIYHHNNNNHHNHNNNNHSIEYHQPHSVTGLNGNGADYEAVTTTNGVNIKSGRSSPAESDTYELTELTPMGKHHDRLTPLSPNAIYRHSSDNNIYHRSGNIITNNHYLHNQLKDPQSPAVLGQPALTQPPPLGSGTPQASLSGNLGPLESSSMLNGSDIATYDNTFRKTVISENFLYTLLRLIKCPQCGFNVSSEQMLKYESQGCLLGVRLPCYNGHLVLDWRL